VADSAHKYGQAGGWQADGCPLQVLVQHEERERGDHHHAPQPEHVQCEVADASIAHRGPAVLDCASQPPERRDTAYRQEDEAGGEDGNRGDGDGPHRSVAGALQYGPLLGTVRGQEDKVMAENQGSQRERREAQQVAPSLGHPQTLACDRVLRQASTLTMSLRSGPETRNFCPRPRVGAA